MDLSAFTAYEREFQSVTSQLQPRISSVMQSTNDAEATAEIRRIESDAVIARQRIADMEVEARAHTEPTRRELGNKIRQYKASLEGVTGDLKRAKEKFQRSSLLGSPAGGAGGRLDFDKSLDQRKRMEEGTAKLSQGTDILNSASNRIEETLSVGEGTLGELHRNRETLMRVQGNTGIVSGTLDEARRILRSMSAREFRTKIALGVFACVVVGIIIGVIVYVVQQRSGSS